MRALLLDLDGVIYQGERPVPGAVETVEWIRQAGIPHLFLTNTSSRPRSAIVSRLSHMGVEVTAEEILTPPVAACDWLREHAVDGLALFIKEATKVEFSSFRLLEEKQEQGAGAVVVGDLGEQWDFPTLNRAFRLLMEESRPFLIALGMTRYWRAADGLRLDAAPFVVALEHATNTHPVVLGKPARPFYAAALGMLGVAANQVMMVGDDIRGDIGGAQDAGLKGILVRTGKYQPADLKGVIRPDAVLDSVAQLPAWWLARIAHQAD